MNHEESKMEITNNFIRSKSGVWLNLDWIKEISVVQVFFDKEDKDSMYQIVVYFENEQEYILSTYESKNLAQTDLDFIMRMKR